MRNTRKSRAEIRALNGYGECSGNLFENTHCFFFFVKLLSRLLLIHSIQKGSQIWGCVFWDNVCKSLKIGLDCCEACVSFSSEAQRSVSELIRTTKNRVSVCVWYLITCYLLLALWMHDSKMMETSPACKNTHRQTDKSLTWKKEWMLVSVIYVIMSTLCLLNAVWNFWDIKHWEKHFESNLNMENCIAFSERKSIWTCGGVRSSLSTSNAHKPVITSNAMAVFVLVWAFSSGLCVLITCGNVNIDRKLNY